MELMVGKEAVVHTNQNGGGGRLGRVSGCVCGLD